MARIDAVLRRLYQTLPPNLSRHFLHWRFLLIILHLSLLLCSSVLLITWHDLIVFLEAFDIGMLILHFLLESRGQLGINHSLVLQLFRHLLDRLLHSGKDAVLQGELLRILLVILGRVLLIVLVRLKLWLLEDLPAHLVTSSERHRDVVWVIVRVQISLVLSRLLLVIPRVGRLVAVTLVA